MILLIPFVLGYILDLIIGDPQNIPHPIRFIGLLINKTEKVLRKRDTFFKFKGLLLLLFVGGVTFLVSYFLVKVSYFIFSTILIYQILATKSLYTESNKVYKALLCGDIKKARLYLSYLVTRDCENMTEEDIVRSTIETISENIVDAITSPLFYIAIGGAPLGMLYKSINTLDSMVGYKNDKYKDFGYFSAKVDDIVNFLPAMVTSLFIILSAFLLKLPVVNSFHILQRDCKNHSSPNSGFAEAPVAGALGIQLGGKVSYFGTIYNKPTMGDDLRPPVIKDIRTTQRIMFLTSLLFFVFMLGVQLLWIN